MGKKQSTEGEMTSSYKNVDFVNVPLTSISNKVSKEMFVVSKSEYRPDQN